MAWENRSGQQYYYRKEWRNGTCVSSYIGKGELGQAIAGIIELEKDEKQLERALWNMEKAEIKAVDSLLGELIKLTRAVTGMALVSAGYHQHKRQWRKKRNE